MLGIPVLFTFVDTDQQETKVKVIQLDLSEWNKKIGGGATEGQESCLAGNFSLFLHHTDRINQNANRPHLGSFKNHS